MRNKLFYAILVLTFLLLPCISSGAEELISMDFRDAQLNDVLKIFSQQAKLNFIADESVRNRQVTLYLDKVTIQDALDTLLTANGLVYIKPEGSNIFVVKESSADEVMLETRVYHLRYSQVSGEWTELDLGEKESTEETDSSEGDTGFEGIDVILESLLSPSGSIAVDLRTNSLIITEEPHRFERIERTIALLDVPTPQVMIESKMIEATLDKDDRMGINWTMQVTAAGAARPTTAPFDRKHFGGSWYPSPNVTSSTSAGSTSGGSSSSAEFAPGEPFPYAEATDFTFGTLDFTQFQAVLEMLDTKSDTKIIANPRIAVMNNEQATILVGTIIPIPIYERNAETGTIEITGYDEERVGTSLDVVPIINDDKFVTVELHPEVSAIIDYTGPNDERPITSTREATTKVKVRSGETIVIGGLVKDTVINNDNKVPFLGDIPILGRLFSYKSKAIDKTDLLVFITPHIVKDTEDLSAKKLAITDAEGDFELKDALIYPMIREQDE